MLNWIKRKAKLPFSSCPEIKEGKKISIDMFLTDQNMFSQHKNQKVKIFTYNLEGEEYCSEVSLDMTVENIKLMMIGHFFNPMEEVNYTDGDPSCSSQTNKSNKYRLVCVRNYQNLNDENSLSEESIVDNDKLLLVKCKKLNFKNQVPSTLDYFSPYESELAVSMDKIATETRYLNSLNMGRQAEPSTPLVDFKIALRRILLTLIKASARLISVDGNSAKTFVQIFKQLEKRHKPRIDKMTLKQLIDMGFNEKKATTALILKRNASEAMEWLLDESNTDDSSTEVESDILNMKTVDAESYFTGAVDPAANVIKEFNKYAYRWFQPDPKAVQTLQDIGYGIDICREALCTTFNNEQVARQLLEGNNTTALEMHEGYERDIPIMAAIIESPIIQLALPKPKTLFALMVLCENPNSANIWLSDNDTHPFVSQILRIYHAEKYRLSKLSKNTENDETSNSEATSFRLYERAENPCTPPRRRFGTSTAPVLPLNQASTSRSSDCLPNTTERQMEDVNMED